MQSETGKVNMPHSFPAHFRQRNFHAAFFANNAAVLQSFIFAAKTLIITDRAKNFGAEQTITLGFEGTVIDGFRFFYFTI